MSCHSWDTPSIWQGNTPCTLFPSVSCQDVFYLESFFYIHKIRWWLAIVWPMHHRFLVWCYQICMKHIVDCPLVWDFYPIYHWGYLFQDFERSVTFWGKFYWRVEGFQICTLNPYLISFLIRTELFIARVLITIIFWAFSRLVFAASWTCSIYSILSVYDGTWLGAVGHSTLGVYPIIMLKGVWPVVVLGCWLCMNSASGNHRCQSFCCLLQYMQRYISASWLVLSACPSVLGW